jgi:bis(5'-nucleosyl)-tetraphosphatase (symmetrical)
MSIYAVGDIQGCYDVLRRLLDRVAFDPHVDRLWVVGDIVNRGPQSLEALRFIYSLNDRATVVLGNHDLHLLAVAHDLRPLHPSDTLQPILDAHDCDALIHWLRHQPLLHHDETLNYVMVHAGIAPSWSLTKAKRYANEVENALQSKHYLNYLADMYGNTPPQWDEMLCGTDRLRVITNYFTRMRCLTKKGDLNLKNKGLPEKKDIPWFAYPKRKTKDERIIFGHWAMLDGNTNDPNTIGLDTGCVWGNRLTLMCLDDGKLFSEKSSL